MAPLRLIVIMTFLLCLVGISLEAPVAEAIRIRSDLAEGRFVRVSQKDMTVRANGGRKSECFIYVNSFEESARVHVCMQNQLLC